MNSADIKAAARRFGADLVGISPISRFDELPESSDPRSFAPDTRSVITVGHRILRGAFRGIEEGTSFHNTYGCFGVNWSEAFFLAQTVHDLCHEIEETGAEAVPLLSREYEENKFVPDYKFYAHACGVGSVGKGGFFLTPEYGHRQRFGFIFTTLELEGDGIIECDFCKDCNACIESCPFGAYNQNGSPDPEICRHCKNGMFNRPGSCDRLDRYASLCGRACLTAVEKKISNTFNADFRKRSVWCLGRDGEIITNSNQFVGGNCPDKFEGK